MSKVKTIGKFDIYRLEDNEQIEKGLKWGLINTETTRTTETIYPCDMDFFTATKQAAIRRAMMWD